MAISERMASPNRIKILHVVDDVGGGGCQNILKILISRLDPARYDHVVCGIRRVEFSAGDRFPRDRAQVLCLNWQDRGGRSQLTALARVIRQVRPDIVHTRNWGGIEAILAGRLIGGCALVHSEHGVDTDTVKEEPWRRRMFRRIIFHVSDRVMCVSQQLKETYARRTGFPERRILVIHNGVDAARFFPDPAVRAGIRAELGVAPEEFCIGCVGNLTNVKDYPTVLRAVDELTRRRLPWRLMVVGEGPQKARIEGIIAAYPEWRNRVSLLGASERVPELLRAMDVYVLSSITEGTSNALLEAMATGLPVVATATGGNPEVVCDGESGLLFPVGDWGTLADSLQSLYDQPELRRVLGRNALKRVRVEFSVDSLIRNYAELYESLEASRRTAGLKDSRFPGGATRKGDMQIS